MPTLDYLTGPYDAIWALLEGEAEWAARVRPGNRIKWGAGRLAPGKDVRADADFPEAELRLGELRDSLAAGVAVFGRARWVEELTQQYVLRLTHADPRLGPADALKALTLSALRAGLPRLGLAYVTGVGPIVAQDHEPSALASRATRVAAPGTPGPSGPPRLLTTFHVPVTMRFPAAPGGLGA